jgi:NAD(P)-dependent dehydrogenase (short-subunit alcohol dehydrogenase family)
VPDSFASLEGKVALISGTAGGQGRAAARIFAEAGCRIVGCDVNEAGARDTVEMVTSAGGDMISCAPLDVSVENGADEWIAAAIERYGQIDILYNNAASSWLGTFEDMSLENWNFTMRHELDIVCLPTRAAWPHLIAAGGGVVINTGSIAGLSGLRYIGCAAVGPAKAGVISFTQQLCVSGAAHGIRAVSISPGVIRSAATEPFIAMPNSPLDPVRAVTPAGRFGEPEDVAFLARFLASDNASFINGVNIVVDGGLTQAAL